MPPISIQQAYDAMQRHRLKCKSKQVGKMVLRGLGDRLRSADEVLIKDLLDVVQRMEASYAHNGNLSQGEWYNLCDCIYKACENQRVWLPIYYGGNALVVPKGSRVVKIPDEITLPCLLYEKPSELSKGERIT